ncbi:GNAT family N-acetyltransferase [Massilia sp. LC238]|uniref:GNAT family N-acetyltransferase n=1 Tax=Massilia sp. LC238 TaxID=1502852 RepID=UPI0004E462C5|nr:GNAT family N-acetyltransferase [Massilia sp. LC238]KFC61958.1 putative acetyltransferase [Massilia sp. LC238]
MIRRAALSDLGALLSMGRKFFAASGYADIARFDEESFRRTVDQLMTDNAVCLVAEIDGQVVGAAGALAYPFYFDASHKTGQEVFWWLDPEHRGGQVGIRLFAELEAWARAQGCKSFTMIALDAVDAWRVGKIYQRCGYRPSEHSYIKELK